MGARMMKPGKRSSAAFGLSPGERALGAVNVFLLTIIGLMMVLPFIFIPFIIGFPAGLVVYWITTNIWTIGQQFAVNKFIPVPDIPTPAEVAAVKAPPPPPKKKKRRR